MRRNLRLLSIIFLVLSGFCASAQTVTYSYTGSIQYYTVPAGVTAVSVDVVAGTGGLSSSSNGGCGGAVHCRLAVTAGQVLNIFPGSAGGDATFYTGGTGGATGPSTNISGGAGAASMSGFGGSGGGGGASDIRVGGIGLGNRVVVAGAGGGGGDDGCGIETGGDGGGPGTAANGLDCGSYNAFSCGSGASTLAGGAGSGGGGFSGAPLVGGDGVALATYVSSWFGGGYYTYTDGGGGGGGYYGGGGGSAGGGGGGSSYADPVLCSSVSSVAGANCLGDGSVTICAPVPGAIVGPGILCTGSGTVTYTNPTGTPGGTWSSSATLTATVNPATGAVTPLAPGTFTLTYTTPTTACGAGSASMLITIATGSVAPITGTLSTCPNTAIVSISDTVFDTTPGGTWSVTSGSTIVSIDPATGIYSPLAVGTATISYTVGSCSATAIVTVNPAPAAIVGPTAVCNGSTITLTDITAGGTWSSNFPTAASVTPLTGVVTGRIPGAFVDIFYTLPDGCYTYQFVRVNNPPQPITGPNHVCQANTVVLTETVPGGTWSVSAPGVISTISSGSAPPFGFAEDTVTGVAGGIVTIQYSITSCPSATYLFTVNPGPANITGSSAVCTGMVTSLSDATSGGTWSSTDTSIHVDTAGHVTGTVSPASGTIVYTLPTGCFTTLNVNVSTGPPSITGTPYVCQGASDTLYDADTTHSGIWSSTNLAIAQVIDSSGVVTGISAGAVNISYTWPSGCFAVLPFVVNPPVTPVVSVAGYPAGILCAGDSSTFVATTVNAGTPTYQWSIFGVPVPGATNDTFSYNPTHGDVVYCTIVASGVCALDDTAAGIFPVNVYPDTVSPIVTIMTSGSDTISMIGQTVTFFSNVTWGGTSPSYQWYLNGVAIPGATNSSYSTAVYASDTFYCMVTGNAPCPSTTVTAGMSNIIIIHDYLGVRPLSAGSNEFSLFPNPNNGTFTLTGSLASGINNDVTYEVSDMLGQVVHTGKTKAHNGEVSVQISINNLAAGSYMLRVNTSDGNETFHFVVGK